VLQQHISVKIGWNSIFQAPFWSLKFISPIYRQKPLGIRLDEVPLSFIALSPLGIDHDFN